MTTYPKHPQPTSWSPVLDMFHGIGLFTKGGNLETTPSRLGFGNNPMEAGR